MITIVLVIFKYDFKYTVSINGKLDKKCNSNMKKSSCNSNTKNSARNSNVTEANT